MDAPCYCTNHCSEKPFQDQASSSMELDSALHELGMLSTVTESRINYLKAKMKMRLKERLERKDRPGSSYASSPLCILQMNSDFITNFSLSKSSCSSDCDSQEELSDNMLQMLHISDRKDSADPGPLVFDFKRCELSPRDERRAMNSYTELTPQEERRRMDRRRRRERMSNPYDFPWRSKLEDSLRNIPASTAAVPERANSPVVSRQDSGNKSNPSSPVKSQNSLTTSGSSIARSRSLDDLERRILENCKEDSNSSCSSARSDIDNVSQRISKLHVS